MAGSRTKYRVTPRGAWSALALVLGACGGGGGGSSGSTSDTGSPGGAVVEAPAPIPAVSTRPAPVPSGTAASYQTAEYGRQAGLALIDASGAYAAGAAGQGLIVAVNDGQVDTGNPAFAGRIADGVKSWVGSLLPTSHGTHVAGLIAAARDGADTMGVAWAAEILPLASFEMNDSGELKGDGDAPYQAIAYAADHGAYVVNNSWGSDPGADMPEALIDAVQHAAERGTITVFSTGNNDSLLGGLLTLSPQPNTTALVPAYAPEVEALFVAVTAVANDGRIGSYANLCGDAAAWCLAAPGGGDSALFDGNGLLSTITDGLTGRKSGTSMAAAQVSGAIAVIASRFPELRPEQVVARMLASADDGGLYADTATYGHGLLDLGAATKPLSTLQAASVGEVVETGTSSGPSGAGGLSLGGAFGNAVGTALAGLPVALFDRFDGATFYGDLGRLATPATHRSFTTASLDDFGFERFAEIRGGHGLMLALGERQSELGAGAALVGTSLATSRKAAAAYYAMGAGFAAFGGVAAPLSATLPQLRGLPVEAGLTLKDNPLLPGVLALTEAPTILGLSYAPGAGTRLSVAVLRDSDALDTVGSRAGMTGAMVDLSGVVARGLTVDLSLTHLVEEAGLLGSTGDGALTPGRAVTEQVSIGVSYAVSHNTALFGRYDRATTKAGDGAWLAAGDRIQAEAWTIGLVGAAAVIEGDRWGFLVSQPLRVTDGSVMVNRPTGRDRNGVVQGDQVEVPLAADGRQLDLEAYYALPVGAESLLGFNLRYTLEPDNRANAAADLVGMIRYRTRF